MTFAQRLESLMKRDGVTKYRISKTVGCSATTVSNWLNGTAPTGDYLQKLSEMFSVSVDYLLGTEKEPLTDSEGLEHKPEDKIDLSDVDIAFLGGFKELTEENQATIRDMVRIMRERQKE